MTTTDKAGFWQEHIKAWRHSGLTQVQYCDQHQLKFHNFAAWRTRLNRVTKTKTSKLLPLNLPSESRRVVLALPEGVRVEVSVTDITMVLPQILTALRAQS